MRRRVRSPDGSSLFDTFGPEPDRPSGRTPAQAPSVNGKTCVTDIANCTRPPGLRLQPIAAGADGRSVEAALPDDPEIVYDDRRVARYRRRQVMRSLEEPLPPSAPGGKPRRSMRASCGRYDTTVRLERKGGKLVYRGILSCWAIWHCAVCAPKLRHRRGLLLERAIARFVELYPDGEVLLVTATIRHAASMPLAATLDAVLDSWRLGVCSGKAWVTARERFGVIGQVRATEIQAGGAAGWHPHLHVALLVERRLDASELAELQAGMYRRWSRRLVARHGLAAPSPDRGLRVDRVTATSAAGYLTKAEAVEGDCAAGSSTTVDAHVLALEMTRHDLKQGRGDAPSVAPFELLDRYDAARRAGKRGEAAQWAALWREYVAATAGRQCMHWSRGLKSLLGVGGENEDEWEEPDGADVGYDEDPDTHPDGVVFSFHGLEWAALSVACRGAGPAYLLDLVEQGCFGAARRLVGLAVARFEERHGGVGPPVYVRAWATREVVRYQCRGDGAVTVAAAMPGGVPADVFEGVADNDLDQWLKGRTEVWSLSALRELLPPVAYRVLAEARHTVGRAA